MRQHTIKNIISFSGVGLHTGCNVNVRIRPSKADTGITFIRTDIAGAAPIKANAANVVATNYATSLGVSNVKVSTVEHLLAAFYGFGVDNAVVELDGSEVPVLDGSAAHFIEMLEETGLTKQSASKKYLVVKKPIKVFDGEKYAFLLPSKDRQFIVDYSIDFAHSFLSKQSFSSLFSKDVFKDEVANARTFGFLRDIEMLKANGLARGGSLENAVVIGEDSILNADGLRYPDEFVRHKVLDMVGDISLIGYQVIGCLVACRSGHALNYRLVQELLGRPGSWVLSDMLADASREAQGRYFVEKAVPVPA